MAFVDEIERHERARTRRSGWVELRVALAGAALYWPGCGITAR
jgi:hypothetical protein